MENRNTSSASDNKKPPVGLRPRWMSEDERINEIFEAILRYHKARKEVPIEWIEELIDIVT